MAIGRAGTDPPEVAEAAARVAYAFDPGPIQFKPTMASEIPFRQDPEGSPMAIRTSDSAGQLYCQ